jgi:DNA-binding XRE family transcriptional regulator
MSQQQVAKAIGIHRPAMTLIEDGRRKMNSLELYKLCKLYGVMVDALFMGEKDWQHIMVEVTSDEGVWR